MKKATFLLFLALIIIGISIPSMGGRDLRAEKLATFFASKGSPLKDHAHEILYCADKFDLDYRLYAAISGAESSYGKRYSKRTNNLTGICNGRTGFTSIYDNIYKTHELIATGKWYKKYHQTNNIKDLVYIYKGVPPYDRYIRTVRYTLDTITKTPVKQAEIKTPNLADILH